MPTDFSSAALEALIAPPLRVGALPSWAHREFAHLTPLLTDAFRATSTVATKSTPAGVVDRDEGRPACLLANLGGPAALQRVLANPERILAAFSDTHQLLALLQVFLADALEARRALVGTRMGGATGSRLQRPRFLPSISDGEEEQQRESGSGDSRNHDDDC